MGDENSTTYIEDVPVDIDNNCYLFGHDIDYAQAKFLQASKMLKGLISILFSDYDLKSIQEQLSYKIIYEIQALMTKLLYGKVMQ